MDFVAENLDVDLPTRGPDIRACVRNSYTCLTPPAQSLTLPATHHTATGLDCT